MPQNYCLRPWFFNGLLLALGAVLFYFAVPTLEKPCHLVTAMASADGTKIYLQTEPPRFGQVEHRYELDLSTGRWSMLSRDEVLCFGQLRKGVGVIRVAKDARDSNGVPMYRRWFHVPDDALATDSPTLRFELWFGKSRWLQTWKEFNRYEMREYEDREQTKLADKPKQYAFEVIRSRDGSRLVVCKSTNSKENNYELWADDAHAPVIARWKGQSIGVDDEANQIALVTTTVSGEKKVLIHSLDDGSLVNEYSSIKIGTTSSVFDFSGIASRLLVSDKQAIYLVDYQTGFRVPFDASRFRRMGENFELHGNHVMTETQIFDAENGKLLFKDNSPIYTFRMLIANSNRVAEVIKTVSATGQGRALVAAPYLTGTVLVRDLGDNSIHRQFEAPTQIDQRDTAILVLFALWSVFWIGYSRIALKKGAYLICTILYLTILVSLAVYRLENSGLVTQFDRPVKWLLAGLLLGTGAQVALWLWCGATPFWIRTIFSCLYCAVAVVVAKDRVFTRLSSTLDGMLTAILLVLFSLICVAVFVGGRWGYGRWFGLHLRPKTHFSILNLLICITIVSLAMSVLIQFRKTLLGSVVFEPPALHAMLYAWGAIPLALLLRQCKPRLWCEATIAFCLLVGGAVVARIMIGEANLSTLDQYLSFACFHGAWAICAVAWCGQDYQCSAVVTTRQE